MPLEGNTPVNARDDLIAGLVEHACCFSEEDAQRLVVGHRDQVALEIGRDALKDGLVPTLIRLVGEANATRLLAEHRNAIAHDLAERQRAYAEAEDGEPGCWHDGAHGVANLIDPKKGTPR